MAIRRASRHRRRSRAVPPGAQVDAAAAAGRHGRGRGGAGRRHRCRRSTQHPCDVLLLDLQMERNAFVDIEALAERVAVVVVTATERVEDALAAIRAGARGLVFKRFAIETLMTAIRTVMEGTSGCRRRCRRRSRARLREPAERHAHAARARDRPPRRARAAQRRGGRAARHQRGHREDAPEQHLPEARASAIGSS